MLSACLQVTGFQYCMRDKARFWCIILTKLAQALLTAIVQVKRMTMTADGQGAVFDVPSGKVPEFMSRCSQAAMGDAAGRGYVMVPAALPELKARAGGEASAFGGQMQTGSGSGYGGSGYGGRGYGGGRGFGGGGRAGSGGARSGRGSFGRRGGAFVSGRRS